jgi:hypothetical protein
MRKILIALAVLAGGALAALGASQMIETNPAQEPPTGGPVTTTIFTPLHTYYMSPTGSDAANGLTPGTAWATANHSVVCGDVIIAASGSYTFTNVNVLGNSGGRQVGPVSNCPSTTGGIDGTGGIYFAVVLCGGADLEACQITFSCSPAGAGCRAAFDPTNNNWAVEGFKVTNVHPSTEQCFEANANSAGVQLAYFAAINNICYNSGMAFANNDGGNSNSGVDYMAAVGLLTQNAAQLTAFSVCIASIDNVAPRNFDSNAGTHVFFYGNFVGYAQSPTCANDTNGSGSDSESFMFDSWNVHNYNGQGIMANNLAWRAMRSCLQFTFGSTTLTQAIKFYNNTCYGDNTNTGPDFGDGSITFAGNGGTDPIHLSFLNNIAQEDIAISGSGGNRVYAAVWGANTWTNLVSGTTGNENVFKGLANGCDGRICDAGNNTAAFANNGLGTNFYVDPAFNNVTDLINNWTNITPNCSGYHTTTECFGWSAKTKTLRINTPIYDLTPTCAQCSGKGYQLPSTTCAPNADYPTWLKGIVYLRVSGSQIIEDTDLVTKPCGL